MSFNCFLTFNVSLLIPVGPDWSLLAEEQSHDDFDHVWLPIRAQNIIGKLFISLRPISTASVIV